MLVYEVYHLFTILNELVIIRVTYVIHYVEVLMEGAGWVKGGALEGAGLGRHFLALGIEPSTKARRRHDEGKSEDDMESCLGGNDASKTGKED